eukprot:1144677-Pelagomonas_calceolata.AAC.1
MVQMASRPRAQPAVQSSVQGCAPAQNSILLALVLSRSVCYMHRLVSYAALAVPSSSGLGALVLSIGMFGSFDDSCRSSTTGNVSNTVASRPV